MTTLHVSRDCQPDGRKLAHLARSSGFKVCWITRHRAPKDLSRSDAHAFYGETTWARHFMAQGLTLLEPTLDLLSTLPRAFLHRDVNLRTLGEALGIDMPMFVKPADCLHKSFDAAVVLSGKRILCSDDLSPETPVLVSEPVRFSVEFRTVVLERAVVAWSPYIRDGRFARNSDGTWPATEAETNEVLSFCRQVLAANMALPPAIVMDVGHIEGRGWAVVEFNPVWCSGLLGCEIAPVLPALQRACCWTHQVSPQDAIWTVRRVAECDG